MANDATRTSSFSFPSKLQAIATAEAKLRSELCLLEKEQRGKLELYREWQMNQFSEWCKLPLGSFPEPPSTRRRSFVQSDGFSTTADSAFEEFSMAAVSEAYMQRSNNNQECTCCMQ
eukprot:GGOE01002325.1.p2 GENE.GGOE01002325.1~~GGOE01002325.1.p2  ORF type:complete len:117 (+),score=22.98 GGOE01002325.1:55-405(+)